MPKMRAPDLKLLHGHESFHAGGNSLGLTLLEYWRWSGSDLLSNAERGVLAEFLVATALGVVDKPRIEWAAHDVKTREGIRVEVKSAAYRQSWAQDTGTVPKIDFDIKKSEQSWDRETNTTTKHDTPRRASDVYVFCVLGTPIGFKYGIDPNPLDTDEWEFYVLDRASLDREKGDQQRIGLNPLKALVREVTKCDEGREAVRYEQLRQAVMEAAERAMLLNARTA